MEKEKEIYNKYCLQAYNNLISMNYDGEYESEFKKLKPALIEEFKNNNLSLEDYEVYLEERWIDSQTQGW